jgi:hypothetical protein|tara:strand:+ start:2314 stop:2928 length:615 start_codon:yes stop_codon:yes gene_type:complete
MQRFEIINTFIKKYNFKNYLEIGVFKGQNIREIIAEHKDGVDPTTELGKSIPEINYPITSDAFFELIKGHDIKYDIIFIDGLHHSDQVNKDIDNALNHLVDNGIIVLHDCNPLVELFTKVPRQSEAWHGDVYKSVLHFRQKSPHKVITVDDDCGCGVIFNNVLENNKCSVNDLIQGIESWEFFDKNRNQLLNLISVDEFKASYQ